MKIDALSDLEISDGGDFVFGPDGEPKTIRAAAVVAQDIRHRLKASQLLPWLWETMTLTAC